MRAHAKKCTGHRNKVLSVHNKVTRCINKFRTVETSNLHQRKSPWKDLQMEPQTRSMTFLTGFCYSTMPLRCIHPFLPGFYAFCNGNRVAK